MLPNALDASTTAAAFMKRVHLLRRCERQKATCVLRGGSRAFALVEGVVAAVTDGRRVADDPETLFAQLVDVMVRAGVRPVLDEPLPVWFPPAPPTSMASVDAIAVEVARRWSERSAHAFARDHLDRPVRLSSEPAVIVTRCELTDERERALVQRLAKGGTLGHALADTGATTQAMASLVLALSALGRLRWATGSPQALSSTAAAASPDPRPRQASQPRTPAARGSRPSSPGRSSEPGAPVRPEVRRTRKRVKRSSFKNLESAGPGDSSAPPRGSEPGRSSSVPSRSSAIPDRRSRPLASQKTPPFDPMAPSTPFVGDRTFEAVSPAEALFDEAREKFADSDGRGAQKLIIEASAVDRKHVELSLYRAFASAFLQHGSLKTASAAASDKLEGLAREVLARDHNAPFAHFVRACIAMAQGRTDDARRGFGLVTRLRPGDRWTRRIVRAMDRSSSRRRSRWTNK